MIAEQTDALVLRVFPWSETSCIATLYTRDFGKVTVVAKGVRRPKSPFEAALDLLSICRIVFIPKAGDALSLLTEAKLTKRFRAGTRDLLRLYAGYYVCELLDRFTDRDDRQADVFDLAVDTLDALAREELDIRAVVLRWEMQLLRMLGHLPTWDNCSQCGDPIAEDLASVFGAEAGGVLCPSCRIGQRQMIQISVLERATLRQFSGANWQQNTMPQYITNGRATIRAVVQRYLNVLLERKLQLHSYLEELGR